MTNLEMLQNSIKKAQEEDMTIINSGEINSENFIIVHNEKAYNIKIENNEIISCDCPDCKFRSKICKHMIKISLEKSLNIKALTLNNNIEES